MGKTKLPTTEDKIKEFLSLSILTGRQSRDVETAMEEYAKQKSLDFVEWYELSHWCFNPSTGTCKNLKFYDVEEKSFEELYNEFELTQK